MIEESPEAALPPLRDIIRNCGLSARKSLGQNYLLDLNLTRRIARAAAPVDEIVIEVGPGPGGLTRALLLEGAAKVVTIERDERFRPALELLHDYFPGRLQTVFADALTVDYAALARETGATRLAANLPYNIATPLLMNWLTSGPWPFWFDRLVLMFQKEVAERVAAQTGEKAYGRLSVISQARTVPRILFHLPARAFTPSPKVDSAVVEICPRREDVPQIPISALERVTAAAFGQRRKMLRSSLRGLTADVGQLLSCAQVLETARAEDLEIGDFWRLAACLIEQRDGETAATHPAPVRPG